MGCQVSTLVLIALLCGGERLGESPASVPPAGKSRDATPQQRDTGKAGIIRPGTDDNDVVSFSSGDPAMDKAMRQATQTLDRFFTAHSSPTPKQSRFSLKIALRSGLRMEYIWLTELRLENDTDVSGILLNQPYYSKAHEQGDRVSVSREAVADWSFVNDGYLIGGYTLRVMFDQYPEDQREALQRQLEYRIDPNIGT